MMNEGGVAEIARRHLSAAEAAKALVRWDSKLLEAGDRLQIGPGVRAMPFDGYLVFVDLAPHMNWSHPARVILVGRHGDEVDCFDAHFPPSTVHGYPESFRIVHLEGSTG